MRDVVADVRDPDSVDQAGRAALEEFGGLQINVASMAAVLPVNGLVPYTVAKHGVRGLSDVLREELRLLGAPVGSASSCQG